MTCIVLQMDPGTLEPSLYLSSSKLNSSNICEEILTIEKVVWHKIDLQRDPARSLFYKSHYYSLRYAVQSAKEWITLVARSFRICGLNCQTVFHLT